jgi:hypothetical protein
MLIINKNPSMKTSKKIKLETHNNYNIVYGSVNNKNPTAVYLTISTWLQPKIDDNLNYDRVIRDLNKRLRQTVYNWISSNPECNLSKNRSIVDLDIRESGIKFNKRSFSNCEITFFLIKEMSFCSELMKDVIETIKNKIIKEVFDDNKYFSFHKRK